TCKAGGGERGQWLRSVAELWSGGVSIGWGALHESRVRNRVELPTYPFERQRYWIEPRLTVFSNTALCGPGIGQVPLHGAAEEIAPVVESAEQMYPRPQLATPFKPPETPLEAGLVEIWKKILGIEQIGIQDDFFDLGGHSLLIVQMVAEIKRTMGFDIEVPRFFEYPCIAHLVLLVQEQQTTEGQTDLDSLGIDDSAELLERVNSMTDEEIDTLLKRMEAGSGKDVTLFESE
ncbi:phosphopantetheine-binding protein, partial [Paenibacillus sp. NPDC055715]